MAIPRRDMEDEELYERERALDREERALDRERALERARDTGTAHAARTETEMISVPFGLSQAVMLCIGIFYVALGTVGLARMGVDSWTTPETTIGAFRMTPLLAAITLGVGIFALAGAVTRSASRGMSMFLGPLLVAAGIVVYLQTIDALGTNRNDAILYAASGVAALIGAMATPAMTVATSHSTATADRTF